MDHQLPISETAAPEAISGAVLPDRPLGIAVRRGLRCRCPACGEAPLYRKYLKVVDRCEACGTELHHQRADDGPAYLTILIVAHVVGLALLPMVEYGMRPLYIALVLCVLSTVSALWMLPRMKGLLVAIQWSKRMHGFGRASHADRPQTDRPETDRQLSA